VVVILLLLLCQARLRLVCLITNVIEYDDCNQLGKYVSTSVIRDAADVYYCYYYKYDNNMIRHYSCIVRLSNVSVR